MGHTPTVRPTTPQGRIILYIRKLEDRVNELQKENLDIINVNRELYFENKSLHEELKRSK